VKEMKEICRVQTQQSAEFSAAFTVEAHWPDIIHLREISSLKMFVERLKLGK
jgi:hypothetical protein